MRISDWSSDVCSSDLSTANTARPACPNLSLRAGREGDEAIEQLPARKHLSGERRYGEQRIAAAQQFGEEQKRRRPRCRDRKSVVSVKSVSVHVDLGGRRIIKKKN